MPAAWWVNRKVATREIRPGIRSYSVLILALDTTTRDGSVAVSRNDTIVAVVQGDGSRTHGERLPDEIERALSASGVSLRELDLLAVASGPGAFTGLRIGLAAVQGLAMVLGTPVVGVSALDALACATWPGIAAPHETCLVTWMDAGRGEVFGAEYVSDFHSTDFPWRQRAVPIVDLPSAILATFEPGPDLRATFVGDGALKYRTTIESCSAGRWPIVAPPMSLAPAIATIGGRLAARGLAGPPHALQPLYVRRPDAELERLRHTGR